MRNVLADQSEGYMNGIPGWVVQILLFIIIVIVLVWAAGQLGIHF